MASRDEKGYSAMSSGSAKDAEDSRKKGLGEESDLTQMLEELGKGWSGREVRENPSRGSGAGELVEACRETQEAKCRWSWELDDEGNSWRGLWEAVDLDSSCLLGLCPSVRWSHFSEGQQSGGRTCLSFLTPHLDKGVFCWNLLILQRFNKGSTKIPLLIHPVSLRGSLSV